MFLMFSACSEPRETIYNHISAALAEFQDKFVKNDLFGLENDCQTHVIKNIMIRNSVRLKTLILDNVLNIHSHHMR